MDGLEKLKNVIDLQNQFKQKYKLTTYEERSKILNKLTLNILKRKKDIEDALYADLRKNDTYSGYADVYGLLSELNEIKSNLKKWMKPISVRNEKGFIGTDSYMLYEPKGVCLIYSHWSYPFFLPILQLISCLAAGNTAILYLPAKTSHTTTFLKELISEIYSSKIVYIITSDEVSIPDLLQPTYDYIHYVGNAEDAENLGKFVKPYLTNINYQISGKSPVILDQQIELDDAVQKILWAKFLNVGQTCVAPDYILLPKALEYAFINKMNELLLDAFTDMPQRSRYYTRMVDFEQFDRVVALLEDAHKKGALLQSIYDYDRRDLYIGPQIISSIPDNADINDTEILGPVLPIYTYETEDELITFINRRSKPLTQYIFTNNPEFYKNIIQKTSSGSVCVNNCLIQIMHPKLPFGSTNSGGLAGSTGKYGFLNYSNVKSIVAFEQMASMNLLSNDAESPVKKIFNWLKG